MEGPQLALLRPNSSRRLLEDHNQWTAAPSLGPTTSFSSDWEGELPVNRDPMVPSSPINLLIYLFTETVDWLLEIEDRHDGLVRWLLKVD